jgi:hypothetical protein
MLTPESPQPDRSGYSADSSFGHRKTKLDASTLPPGDQNAQAQLIIEALPIIERGEWRMLTRSSKELIGSAGLIARPHPGLRYGPVPSFEDFQSLVGSLPRDAQLLGARALLLLTERFGSIAASATVTHLKLLAQWFHEKSPAPDHAIVDAYRKLVLALLEDRNLQQHAFEGGSLEEILGRRLSHVKLASQLVRYLGAKDPEDQRAARAYLYDHGGHNDLPFLDGEKFQEARRQVKDKAISTALRSYKYAFNFDRLSGETRRAGPGTESILAQFGQECFEDCRAIFGSAIERTPGRGYYLGNPREDKLFFPELLQDGSYARNYAHYGNALKQFQDAHFFFLRGDIVVYHPSQDYHLPVGAALPAQRRESYTLYLANNHFSGSYELAALLPVTVLKKYLMPSLQSLSPTLDDSTPRDISMPGFNLTTLIRACEDAGLPAIMLANISTVFGGSVAGYPKGSEPYYGWEYQRGETASSAWHDALGRVHHAWYVRTGYGIPTAEDRLRFYQDLLHPLGDGCHKVADAAKGLFDLLDLFMARYDAWKCDLVPSESLSPRMLVEAYRFHDKLHERNAPADAFPLLCLAHRYDWTRPPEPILDTVNLELLIGDGKRFPLPPRTRGEGVVELGAWMRYVRPRIADRIGDNQFAERDVTLVLLPREYVHSSQEDVPLPKL